ncbi:MFS transporter [Sphingomonas bacterium]|uniref:MFS transporter n=1 Tax=Sphingomonas bacterium TaxID=1895847 RepID=UPI0015773195|nr:MFS transporter [Sphingomonas bacterium]
MRSSSPDAATASSVRSRLLIFLIAGAMFMENLDGTIITTALPVMARSFARSAVDLNIGVSAYLLALGTLIPASSWVADRFGTRRTLVLAILVFTFASLLCGAAQNLAQFVAARVLQGTGGAMMVPVGRLIVLRHTPEERLMDAMATLVWPALIAPVLGPPLGGFIVVHADWRWIFYLNLPLGLIAAAATLRLVPDLRSPARLPFDWLGFILCGVGVYGLMAGMDRVVDRADAVSVGLILLGAGSLAMAVRHFRRARHPMIDLSAFRFPTFRAAMRGGSLSRMAIGSAPFLLPLLFQVGFGFDAQTAGLLMLGVFGANLGMKAVTSGILRRAGFRSVLLVSGLLCSLSLAACAMLTARTALPLIVLVLLLGGATRSMQFSTLTMISFADLPKPLMSGANALASTIGQLSLGAGITLGAMSIRLGAPLGLAIGARPAAAAYAGAFLIVAAVSAVGALEALRLPYDAGRRFAGAVR